MLRIDIINKLNIHQEFKDEIIKRASIAIEHIDELQFIRQLGS